MDIYRYIDKYSSWALGVSGLAICMTWQNRLRASARSEFSSKLVLSIIKKKEEGSSSSRMNAVARIPADSETVMAYFPCLERPRCLCSTWTCEIYRLCVKRLLISADLWWCLLTISALTRCWLKRLCCQFYQAVLTVYWQEWQGMNLHFPISAL